MNTALVVCVPLHSSVEGAFRLLRLMGVTEDTRNGFVFYAADGNDLMGGTVLKGFVERR